MGCCEPTVEGTAKNVHVHVCSTLTFSPGPDPAWECQTDHPAGLHGALKTLALRAEPPLPPFWGKPWLSCSSVIAAATYRSPKWRTCLFAFLFTQKHVAISDSHEREWEWEREHNREREPTNTKLCVCEWERECECEREHKRVMSLWASVDTCIISLYNHSVMYVYNIVHVLRGSDFWGFTKNVRPIHKI